MRLTPPHIPIKRIREIIVTFYELGFGFWVKRLKLYSIVPLHKRMMKLSSKTRDLPCPIEGEILRDHEEFPKRFRLALERLGGTFVKLGQMLSLRPDLVTEEVANELRLLQDGVAEVPYSEIKKIIQKELGKSIRKLFKEIDKHPVGSASLAQVHRAVLHDGQVVAIKVLRPGIKPQVLDDIKLVKWLAGLLEKHLPVTRNYQPKNVAREFAEWTKNELNLENEAVNIAHFRKLYNDDEQIFIPAVVWEYSTKNILTMQFSAGAHLDDFSAYRRLRCSREVIASIGTKLAYAQFFEHGFFHGDPHPGNFFVLKNNVLCLHDFGIVGRIDTNTRRELIACFVDFLENDAEGAMKHLLHLAQKTDDANINAFKNEVTMILDRWFYASTKGKRLSQSFYFMVLSGSRHGVIFPSNIVLLAKAIVTMEGMALMLNPDFNIAEELRPYLQQMLTQEFNPKKLIKQGREILIDFSNIVDRVPDVAHKLIKMVDKGSVGITLDTSEFMEIKKEIDRQTDIRLMSLFLVADVIAVAVLLHLEGVRSIGGIRIASIGIGVAVILSIILFFRIRKGAN